MVEICKKQRQNLIIFFVLVFFILVSLYFFKDFVLNYSSILPDKYDGAIITWHLNKFVHASSFFPEKILSGNILFPYRFVQAFTDPYLTDSLIAYPFIRLTQEPVIAYNVNLIISQILCSFQ